MGLVGAIMFVLLHACGLVLPGYGAWHRVGFAYCLERRPAGPSEVERTRLLREMAVQLELRVMRERATCIAQSLPPSPPPTQVAGRSPPQARGPAPQTGGPVPAPAPVAAPVVAPVPAPAPAPARPPSRPDADFPEDKWANKDLGVLNGCWQLGREIRRPPSAREKNPDICLVIKSVRLCLDPTATGKAEVRGEECPDAAPTSCQAPISAAFAGDGTLRMTTKPTTCPDNSHWPKTSFTCRRVDDKALRCADPLGGEDLEFRR